MEMKVIIITPDNHVNNEADIVNKLFDNGLQRLHVRKPLYAANDYRSYIETIKPQYHPRIAVHGDFELYNEFDLGSIHLSSSARNDKNIMEQVAVLPPSVISASFHSWQEVEENEFPYGYVFISPVFDSVSKTGYKAGIDLAGATKLKERFLQQKKYCPAIIGLGGVGAEQTGILQQNGFDGAAMLGTIWMNDDPVAKYIEVMRVINT